MNKTCSVSISILILITVGRCAGQLPQCVPNRIDGEWVVLELPPSVPDTVIKVVWSVDESVVEGTESRQLKLQRNPRESIGFTASAKTTDGIGLCSLQVALAASNLQNIDVSTTSTLSTSIPSGMYARPILPRPRSSTEKVFIHYLTERKDTKANGFPIGNERGTIKYGTAAVYVPADHHTLFKTNPAYWSYDESAFITTLGPNLAEDQFFSEVKSLVAFHDASHTQILVYIHGFNNSFEEEVNKLADLVHETGFRGSPVVFDWPSLAISGAQELLPWKYQQSYTADAAAILESVDHLAGLLSRLSLDNPGIPINIIAHSMGNKLFLLSLKQLASANKLPKLNQVIMAAPDITQDLFSEVMPALVNSGKITRVTVYGTTNDKAMRLSKWANGDRAPLGMLPPLVEVQNVDQVDASHVSMNYIAHDYFVTTKPMLDDIADVLKTTPLPQPRSGLTPAKQGNYSYFVLKPAR